MATSDRRAAVAPHNAGKRELRRNALATAAQMMRQAQDRYNHRHYADLIRELDVMWAENEEGA